MRNNKKQAAAPELTETAQIGLSKLTDSDNTNIIKTNEIENEEVDDSLFRKDYSLIKAPKFPIEILPEVAQDFIKSQNHFNADVIDFSSITYFSLIGAMIGNRITIEPARKSWATHGVLWIAIVGEKGVAKSGSMQSILNPIRKLVNDEYDHYLTSKRQHDAGQSGVSKADKIPFGEQSPRIFIRDTTPEALTRLLISNGCSAFMVMDELDVWFGSMERYKSSSNAPFWIDTWDSGVMEVDRVGSGESILKHPAVSIIGAVQPDIIARYYNDQKLQSSGFIDRILPVFPDIDFQPLPTGSPNPKFQSEYNKHCIAMYKKIRLSKPTTLVMDVEAKQYFMQKVNELREKVNKTEIPIMKEFYNKISKYLGRFTLIIHMIVMEGGAHGTVSLRSVEKAWKLAEYFILMTEKIYQHNNEAKDRLEEFKMAMRKYPDKRQLRYLYLFTEYNWNYKRIAKAEGVSINAIKMGISRARKSLENKKT